MVASVDYKRKMESLIIFFTILLSSVRCEEDANTVNTRLGPVQGLSMEKVIAYLGIPYAMPPVNELRFKAPQPHPGWSWVYQATSERTACLQDPEVMKDYSIEFYQKFMEQEFDEDCLYLNVYTPKDANGLLPVLVMLHGGAFTFGTASQNGQMDGHILAGNTSMVVVQMNYRLNVFGFLPINHPEYPANLGIRDQIAALEWVQENIKEFHGDPNMVTIAGYSAGGASVFTHLQSPKSASLFHRAISFSGFSSGYLLTKAEGEKEYTQKFAKRAGCDISTQEEMIECLITARSPDLLEASKNKGSEYNVLSKLVVDGDIIPRQPYESFDGGHFKKVPLIVSITSEDGDWWPSMIGPEYLHKGLTPEEAHMFASRIIEQSDMVHPNDREKVLNLTLNEYALHLNESERLLRGIYDMGRDAFFMAPSVHVADSYSRTGQDVYFIVFDQPVHYDEFGVIEIGAKHADDMMYLLGWVYTAPDLDPMPDVLRNFTHRYMASIALFAKGEPVKTELGHMLEDTHLDWPLYNEKDRKYLRLNAALFEKNIKSHPYSHSYSFWNKVVAKMQSTRGKSSTQKTEDKESSSKLKTEL